MPRLLQLIAGLLLLVLNMGQCSLTGETNQHTARTLLPTEPLWIAETVDTAQMTVYQQETLHVPNMDQWFLNMNTWPMTAIDYDDGKFVLWGPHRNPQGTEDVAGYVDGSIRWELGSQDVQISLFPIENGSPRYFFFFDPPEQNGFKFGRVGLIDDDETNHYLFSTFDSSLNLQTSSDFTACALWNQINPPMEYPLCSTFFYESLNWDLLSEYMNSETGNGQIFDYRVFSGLASGETWIDPRSGRMDLLHDPLCWFADSSEWICEVRKEVDGERLTDLVVVGVDGSMLSLEPWNWPGFIWHDSEEYTFRDTNISFTNNNNRYFVIGVTGHSDNRAARYWLIRYNPGSDHAEPVWCRENGSWWTSSHKLILLGDDQHPYWVFFHTHRQYLRVVDLLSGVIVLDMDIDSAPFTSETSRYPVFMPFLSESAMRQQSILILDPVGEDIIKIDLEMLDDK